MKSKFRGKSFFRNRQRSGPVGQVTVQGDYLEVDFLYSLERVQAIKAIPQAKFHRESKRWTIPLKNRELLERSLLLGREVLDYQFAENLSLELTPEREAAEERWRENPFSVSTADLELVNPEVIFVLDEAQISLRVKPRFRSVAQQLLARTPAVHYLKNEKSFYFPVELLLDFLKQLRDKGVSFAVEETAAKRLRETAELRATLREGKEGGASPEQLTQALCAPFLEGGVDEEGAPRFRLCHYTSQQLKECFPDIPAHGARRAWAANFDAKGVLALLNRTRTLPFRLWQTADAAWHIKRLHEQLSKGVVASVIDDSVARFISLPACWVRNEKGMSGLLIQQQEFVRLFGKDKKHPLKNFSRIEENGEEKAYFFPIPGGAVIEIKHELERLLTERGEKEFPASKEFSQFLPELSARLEQRQVSRTFRLMRDADLDAAQFSSPEVVTRLFPHQRVAVRWLLETNRAFLGDDMGLGKTLSVLTAFDALAKKGEHDFLLVVCPNSLLRNWLRESRQWFSQRRLAVLPEEKREKIGLLKRIGWGGIAIDGLFVNYESVRLEYVRLELEKLLQSRKVYLCLDESQRVKNPAGKTFHALKSLVPYCQRRVLLSGTPTPKALSDIWSQIFLLDDGQRFGGNYFDWLTEVAELGNRYSEFAVKKFKPVEAKETVSRVQELLLRRKKEDVLSLPEKTFITRDVELKGDQAKRYEEVRKELLLRMTSLQGKAFLREISNVLEEYLRAVQIASNPRLVDESWKGTPAKFQEVDEIVNEIVAEREEKIVLWTNYLGNVRELVKRYEAFGAMALSGEVPLKQRDELVHEFQHGTRVKVLVAVPAAGGVGLTLTAAQTAVYLEKTWNAEHWLQSIDRLHRIGQHGTVRIISLHASRVDELISANLGRKYREQTILLGDGEHVEGVSVPAREELLEAVS